MFPTGGAVGASRRGPLGRSASVVAVTKSAAFRITQTGDRLQSKALTVPPSPWGHPAPALADHTWAVASDGGELLGAGSESLVLVGTNQTRQPVIVLAHVEPGDTLALNRSAPLAGTVNTESSVQRTSGVVVLPRFRHRLHVGIKVEGLERIRCQHL